MGLEAKMMRGCILKGSLVLAMGFCSFLLYRFLPSLVDILVSYSPIVFCTAILLGTLLCFGQANIPRTKEENKKLTTSVTARSADDDTGANEKVKEDGLRKRNKGILTGNSEKEINGENKVIEVEKRDINDDVQRHLDSDAHSSSSDVSVTDVMPMLDELHPLIDSEAPVATLTPSDESDAQESDDFSLDLAGDIENADEEEAQEKAVVTWSADDEKNLKTLGSLEIERNQRLENLIEKRRARNKWMVEAKRNMINGNDGMQIRIPARRNPFHPEYGLDEIPVPGSAPSVLLPRLNPFDLPFEHYDDNINPAGENSSQQDFSTIHQRDTFFRRYESFSLGPSFLGEMNQDRNEFNMRPYFMVEGTTYDTSFQMSDSKVNSVPKANSVSSIADDEDDAKELLEQELHQIGQSNSPANHASKIVGGSEFSEISNSVLDSQFVQSDQVKEPSYDLSPSGLQRGILHDDRESISDSENERRERELDYNGVWTAPPRLCGVVENESNSSRGVRVVCEHDAIQVGMKPEAVHEQGSWNASLPSLAPKSVEETVINDKVDHWLEETQIPPGSFQEYHVAGPQMEMAEKANSEDNHRESQDFSSVPSKSTEKTTGENAKPEPRTGCS